MPKPVTENVTTFTMSIFQCDGDIPLIAHCEKVHLLTSMDTACVMRNSSCAKKYIATAEARRRRGTLVGLVSRNHLVSDALVSREQHYNALPSTRQ